jgi:hypothetical protein
MSGIQGAQGSLGPTGEGFGISSTNPDDQGTVGWQVWE